MEEGQTLIASFTYRINQKKQRQRSGGSREEGGMEGGEF